MIDYAYLHEVEEVVLRSNLRRPVTELLPLFEKQGFVCHEDVVSLDRSDRHPPWQHSSIVEVEVQCAGEEVFGFEESEWDTLLLKYLFASLPFKFVDEFVRVVETTALQLGLIPEFRGKPMDRSTLVAAFDQIRNELLTETGEEPGTEPLAILIHSTYPRRSVTTGEKGGA